VIGSVKATSSLLLEAPQQAPIWIIPSNTRPAAISRGSANG